MAAFHPSQSFFFGNVGAFFPGHFPFAEHQFNSPLGASAFPHAIAPGMHPHALAGHALHPRHAEALNIAKGGFFIGGQVPTAPCPESLKASHHPPHGLKASAANPSAHRAPQNYGAIQEMGKPRGMHLEDAPHCSLASPKADSQDVKCTAKVACASKVFPRRKSGQLRRELSKPVVLTEEVLRQYFNTPLRTTAKELGICATALKKVCRSLGIQKWPYRSLYSQKTTNDEEESDGQSPPPSDKWHSSKPSDSEPPSSASSPRFHTLPSRAGDASLESAGAALLCQLQRSLAESASAALPADDTKCSDNSIDRLLN